MTPLMILYRGPLTSCNYDCPYCPFAKAHDTPETLRADRAALERFVTWCEQATAYELTVLFTPWGEALTRSWYRTAMVTLSHLPHVARVAAQTNAAHAPGWTQAADLGTLALWTTYHPGQVSHERFVARSLELTRLGVRHSVGVVGLPEHLDAARQMRAALPAGTYLWVNAAEGHTYPDAEAADWRAIDPHFDLSRHPHPSLGQACRTGLDAVTVDGAGDVRRCHFVPDEVIGNLYAAPLAPALRPHPCPLAECDCHIGYVHLERLGLRDIFAGGIAERIPAVWG